MARGEARSAANSTVRRAAELGYEVTVLIDATAAYSDREMQAALEVNIPNYAGAVVTPDEIAIALSSLAIAGPSA